MKCIIVYISFVKGGAAEFSRLWISSAQNCAFMCFFNLFFIVLLLFLIRVSSAMIMYDRRTLSDIGQRYTNLIQNTLSTDPAWPLEILRNNVLNNDHLNNRRRRRKHRGRRAGIRNRLRKRAHSPPLPSILLANVQSLENKMDDLRARISFQRDIRDCNIFCLTETWLTPTVPDTAVTPSDNFSVLRMDRSAEAGKNKGGGVYFFINKKWCDSRNISILSRSCSPHLEHLSIICRPFYLPREFSSIVITSVYIPPQADTSLALSKLHDELSGYNNKHPDAAFIIAGDYSGAIESVLTQCISVWYGNSSNQECKALQRVVRLAERISGSALPSLQDIYIKRCKSRAAKILKDSTHPGNHLLCLLPSGKCFRSMMAKTERLRRSFFPQSIRLLSSNSVS